MLLWHNHLSSGINKVSIYSIIITCNYICDYNVPDYKNCPSVHIHTLVLVIRTLFSISALHSAPFPETRLWSGWGRWDTMRPDAQPLWLRGLYHADKGDSTQLLPFYLSPRQKSDFDNQRSPAAQGPGLQNHRRIMNATPSWQLALLWKGEEGHLCSQRMMGRPP